MTEPLSDPQPRHPSKGLAGGFFIAIGLIAGAIIGIAYNQASAGMMGGFVLGGAAAIIVWLLDRRRG
jgi:uncharacterized membrane protein